MEVVHQVDLMELQPVVLRVAHTLLQVVVPLAHPTVPPVVVPQEVVPQARPTAPPVEAHLARPTALLVEALQEVDSQEVPVLVELQLTDTCLLLREETVAVGPAAMEQEGHPMVMEPQAQVEMEQVDLLMVMVLQAQEEMVDSVVDQEVTEATQADVQVATEEVLVDIQAVDQEVTEVVPEDILAEDLVETEVVQEATPAVEQEVIQVEDPEVMEVVLADTQVEDQVVTEEAQVAIQAVDQEVMVQDTQAVDLEVMEVEPEGTQVGDQVETAVEGHRTDTFRLQPVVHQVVEMEDTATAEEHQEVVLVASQDLDPAVVVFLAAQARTTYHPPVAVELLSKRKALTVATCTDDIKPRAISINPPTLTVILYIFSKLVNKR